MERIIVVLLWLVLSMNAFSQSKDVTVVNIPNFQPGKSVFQGAVQSHNGIYIYFMSDQPLAPEFKSYVMKHYGANYWVQSSHNKAFTSIFPVPAENEKDNELSFYWTGTPVPDLNAISKATSSSASLSDAEAAKLVDDVAAQTMPAYGFYNLNNNIPSWDYPGKGSFLKIMSDKSVRPSIYVVGQSQEDMTSMDMEVNIYISSIEHTKGVGHKFEKISKFEGDESELINPYGVPVIPANGKDDKHVIYSKGKILVKVTANKQITTIDLSRFGGPNATITKLVSREGILWVLVGNDIVKIRDNAPEKFYTLKSAIPSFAVDNNEVYTNDGSRISIPFKTAKPILGNGTATPGKQKVMDEFNQVIGQCLVETTAYSLDQHVHFIHPGSGKIFKVQK